MASEAKLGDTVKVHYQAKTKDLLIFDSKKTEPLQIKIGDNQVIPAFEKALIGMGLGEQKSILVPSGEAFGPYIEELVSTINRSELPSHLDLKIGQQLQIQQPDGSIILVTLANLTDKFATFDANHPLAGKDITFQIELLDILK
ncbi:MAG: FKBP-type peptidyl-prolyl cis-trans isomerase [Parachlamydiales bacterium]